MALRYRQLVELRAAQQHGVAQYADALAVSPAHLNRLCRQHLGASAKDVIQDRLEVVARRMLLFSNDSAAQVSRRLGFADPSYFTRFFRRRTGMTPAAFRARSSSD